MKIFKELVRYATMAPSSHNTQCWKFESLEDSITVFPDLDRRCPVVDPDDHHLYVSLGCAVENLVVAAKAHGLAAKVDSSDPVHGIRIDLSQQKRDDARLLDDPLFRAISARQCTRGSYDGKDLTPRELEVLEDAGKGNGVRLNLLTTEADMKTIKMFATRASAAQLNDPSFKNELRSWLRFNDKEAKSMGDGLFGRCMGHPSAPRWIGGLIFDFGTTASAENRKMVDQIDSSAGVAVVVSDKDDPTHWVEAGRCYERFALTATSLGIHNAHLNMPVEVKAIRSEFKQALRLPDKSRPDLVLRFGRGSDLPKSFRRPIEDVLVES
jgi:hypothetical protein